MLFEEINSDLDIEDKIENMKKYVRYITCLGCLVH